MKPIYHIVSETLLYVKEFITRFRKVLYAIGAKAVSESYKRILDQQTFQK
jgi:hypothetical protein